MAYCTLEDIFGRMDEDDVISYTDDDDTGAVDTVKVDQAVESAQALIDAHISARYAVPLNPVPKMIRELACDIAVYKISGRRNQASEARRTGYKEAVSLLEKIAAGKAVIPGATAAAGPSKTDAVKLSSSGRIFSRDSLGGF